MVKCPDRKGVIAALAQLLYGLGCNILASDQFTAEVPPNDPHVACVSVNLQHRQA